VAAERSQVWMRSVERLLFGIAAVAFIWYGAARIEASREQAALSRELERSRATLTSTSTAVRLGTPSSKAAPPLTRSLIGRIEVPRLGLSALAREGVDTRTLRGSAGHVPGSALPGDAGNAAFAAHRDTFFGPLKGVRKGDEITVSTATGAFRYVVSATRVVDPTDVSVLSATAEPTLTLVTCYPFDYFGSAPQRFIVTAHLAPPISAIDR
jgi:sortase A